MTLGIKSRIFSFSIHNKTKVVKMGGSYIVPGLHFVLKKAMLK